MKTIASLATLANTLLMFELGVFVALFKITPLYVGIF
jgi:hypothetical protein